VALEFDVVVDAHAGRLAARDAHALRRQSAQYGYVERTERVGAVARQPAERPRVQVDQQIGDRRIEFGQTEEAAVAQPRGVGKTVLSGPLPSIHHEFSMPHGNGLVVRHLPGFDADIDHSLPLLDHEDIGECIQRLTGTQILDSEIYRLWESPAIHLPEKEKKPGAFEKPTNRAAVKGGQTRITNQIFRVAQCSFEFLTPDTDLNS